MSHQFGPTERDDPYLNSREGQSGFGMGGMTDSNYLDDVDLLHPEGPSFKDGDDEKKDDPPTNSIR